MTPHNRVRAPALAFVLLAVAVTLAACSAYPNSTFNHHTEFNADVDRLWDKLLFWGTLVFVFVEGILIYTIIRFRKREGGPTPQMTHGNTALEITWTLIPVMILVLIAVPTVSTIFRTQAKAPSNSLEIEVVGHQWWWEYRYPQYGFSTANEFYIQNGRPVNFTLRTVDVLHSFWVPQLGGKRDLIANHTNYLWYTPNTDLASSVWNGFCTEYCGTSHANMRIRAYTVSESEFEAWVAGQRAPAVNPVAPANTASAGGSANGFVQTSGGVLAQEPAQGWVFPLEKLPEHAIPKTPVPAGLNYDDNLLAQGNAANGHALFMKSGCTGCHTTDVVIPPATLGPNLSHIGSRHTIAAGLFPNDARHLARWIKNARRMKPGVTMWTFGAGEIDPQTGKAPVTPKLTDQEIADVVAYLRALK
jgi:cytochrome c oxidase subunit 2